MRRKRNTPNENDPYDISVYFNNGLLKDLAEWRLNHPQRTGSIAEYLCDKAISEDVPSDLLFAFIELIWPKFIKKDGMIFLRDSFSQEKLRSLEAQKKHSKYDLELWMNVISIDGLLTASGISSDCEDFQKICTRLVKKLYQSWQTKLDLDFPGEGYRAIYSIDSDDCLIYISSPKHHKND